MSIVQIAKLFVVKPTTMETKSCDLHMLFFPLMIKGHVLPMFEIAKLFAARGATVTVLATPADAALVTPSHLSIRVHLIKLPQNCETLSDNFTSLLDAISTLRLPFDHALRDLRPDCVVSDIFMPWTYDVAASHGVPRLIFDGFGFFARCLEDAFLKQNPLQNGPSSAETLVLHGLPHRIEFLRSQFPGPEEWDKTATISQIWNHAAEVDPKSYGVVVNSFYDLEADYVEHYRNVVRSKAWGVGPAALCDSMKNIRSSNGGEHEQELFKWLDSQKEASVVYMCFGSMSGSSVVQLTEIALGLEASGHPFVWVVRSTGEDGLPQGFEERVHGRGLVFRGWAPQLLILNHGSVGGFVTHCGWNSCLEGIASGLAMATWPLFADQFYNEKLLVDFLRIGVAVGAKEYAMVTENRKEVVTAGMLEAALRKLMGGTEAADERRRRARELKLKARKAVERGGSSYNDVGNLIQELMERRGTK